MLISPLYTMKAEEFILIQHFSYNLRSNKYYTIKKLLNFSTAFLKMLLNLLFLGKLIYQLSITAYVIHHFPINSKNTTCIVSACIAYNFIINKHRRGFNSKTSIR